MESRPRNYERRVKPAATVSRIQHDSEDPLSYTALNKNYTIPKMSAEERERRKVLKDCGIDTKGMSKDEIAEIVRAIELSKQDVIENPYDMDTQTDQSQSSQSGVASPTSHQSKSASQESMSLNEDNQDLLQSDGALQDGNLAMDEDSKQQSENTGSKKPPGRMSFRLYTGQEKLEEASDVNKDKTVKKEPKTEECIAKTSKAPESPDQNGGMFDRVVRTCKKAKAAVFRNLTQKREATQSPVIIPDSPEKEEQSDEDFVPKVNKNSQKRTIVESSDEEEQHFVKEKPKTQNTVSSKRIKLMPSGTEKGMDSQEEHRSPTEKDLEFFKQDLADKYACKTLSTDQNFRKTKSLKKGRSKTRTPLYAPDVKDIESYTKVILQAFEIYHRKLFLLQSKSCNYLAKGEPVKPGRHMEKTIDMKRRGQQEVAITTYIEGDEDITTEDHVYGQFSVNENPIDLMDDDAVPHKGIKTGPAKTEIRPLKLTKTRRKVSKEKDSVKNTVNIMDDDDDDLMEVMDQSSQVELPPLEGQKEDRELSDYFLGQDRENDSETIHEQKRVQDRHTPDILIAEETFLKFDKKQGPKKNGKASQKTRKPEKQLQFDVQALRNRVTESKKNDKDHNSQSTISENMSQTGFKRHHSDISTASTDSTSRMEEEFIRELSQKDKSIKYGTSHLTRKPGIMLKPDGDVYATQMCAMEEKHSNKFEFNEENSNTQMTENYFDVGGIGDQTNSIIVNDEESVEMAATKRDVEKEDHVIEEVITDDSEEEVIFSVKQPKEKVPRQKENSSQEGEVKLNIKRRLGPKKTRKFQIAESDESSDSPVSNEDKKVERDVCVESGEEWLSARNWTINKPTVKAYTRRTRANESSVKPAPKVTELVPCPMCYRKFHCDHIQTHAAECEGEINDDANENMDTKAGQNQENPSPSRNTPGQSCIVCLEPLPQGFDEIAHPQCLEEATQAQHQADNKMFYNTQVEEPRTTRSRGRSQQVKTANQKTDAANPFVFNIDDN
ncbi:uncharacterized protein LOC134253779 [Saccostrea cucullata]|uniref:uncharacterized protein LOC134253779 n=1 Tax=Saccostrea cuccullata TaxID=36930 RepID=UPI002ED4257A